MAKTEKTDTQESGEQLDLIDIAAKNAKPIIKAARLYKQFQLARLGALKKEIEQKQKVLELVRAADLQPLAGGKIRFEYDGVTISITPRDELVAVKEMVESE